MLGYAPECFVATLQRFRSDTTAAANAMAVEALRSTDASARSPLPRGKPRAARPVSRGEENRVQT